MKFVAVTLALLLAACGQGDGVDVSNAQYRPPLTEGGVGVAYFSIKSGTSDRIVEVSSSQADRIEIHASIDEAGAAKMKHLDSVELPAGETVAFAPRGLHLMVFGSKPLVPGATFPIQISLQSGRKESVEFDQATLGQTTGQ